MTHTVVLTLSDTLFEQLRRTAELAQQPVDRIIEQSLAHSLPPLLEDIPVEYQADVYPLLQMSAQQLLKEARQVYPRERWQQYEALLAYKESQGLTPDDERRLTSLRREADTLSLRKAYAAVLLKRRGLTPPIAAELAEPS